MSRGIVALIGLIIGAISYYGIVFVLARITLNTLRVKKRIRGYIILFVVTSIPIFCVIDYLNRGIPFIVFMSAVGYLISGFLIYYSLGFVFFGFFRWLLKRITKGRAVKKVFTLNYLFFCTLLSLFVCLAGVLAARFSVTTSIEVELGGKSEIKMVALSDIHYGSTGSVLSLERMVDQINEKEPDVVVFIGDVFDNHIRFLSHEDFVHALSRIESTYGVYAVTGNHEFATNSLEDIEAFYEGTNVKLLLDEEVIIDGRLRIAGRMDYNYQREERLPLSSFVSNSTLPLIVLDHQPQLYREALEVNARLQISGHTHNGQIFPGDLLMRLYNKVLYDSPSIGMNQFDDMLLAITRGYGTWGFPMRLSGASEILSFKLYC